jgi:SAM-dependent methyltransferase
LVTVTLGVVTVGMTVLAAGERAGQEGAAAGAVPTFAKDVAPILYEHYMAKPDRAPNRVLRPNRQLDRVPESSNPPGLRPRRREEGMTKKLIGTYAVGTNPQVLRPGTALRLEPGGVIELQMHYTPTGVASTDRTRVGLVFSDDPEPEEVRATAFINGTFTIPAGARDVRVDADVDVLQDMTLWALLPHTHLRGVKWEYRLERPDGTQEPILSVPRYDFDWQTYYFFKEPLVVPAGSRIISSAWYDNSTLNRSNPDPAVAVGWGDQTWEEMQYTGLLFSAGTAAAQEPFEPQVGQAGKDVVWVPTPAVLVERMLDLAQVTGDDFVMDLGSGDGRNVIAAARRGARALGVEYNPDMVALSRRLADEAGVSDRATFVEGDMYEADVSDATVLALFLLPDNLRRLLPKFLELAPGTRIVGNTFSFDDWPADDTYREEGDCSSWCTALLWIVPARVEGTWRLPAGELSLTQRFQVLSGTLTNGSTTTSVTGRLRGEAITFSTAGMDYEGRVRGEAMSGTVMSGAQRDAWTATRVRQPSATP